MKNKNKIVKPKQPTQSEDYGDDDDNMTEE